ncbi:hypothetical protein KOW79_019934 [Hemibagrus wyckioides]|uniref:Lipocalin/cytosolic fatty-acid binding domain-containing protein n=1 Tax=Hemibagrus wyckioides TaxID=337641 RepID=A0A9D3N7T4_9TELE|nr:fatty acid-binding protein, brain-like [Hemibagrus wyckioides]KAG7316393.1 hypothetical protein KOW79_019934 [Hemibagrus wyckioides]
MEKFIGVWKLVNAENFDEYMKAFGISDEWRNIGHVLKPKMIISQDDDTVVFDVESLVANQKISFKLGEEFQSKTMDGKDCKVTVSLDGDSLIEVSKWDDSESCNVYMIKDGQLIKSMSYEDIVAVRTFEKV